MKYTQKVYPEYKVKADISIFKSSAEGLAEYHLMLHATGTETNFAKQLEALHLAYTDLLTQELKMGVPVFKRYLLSDAANQCDLLDEKLGKMPDCAVSVVQQPPLDGSKVALWVYLVSGITPEISNDMFGFTSGPYSHYWAARRRIASENSACQTQFLLEEYEQQLQTVGCTIEANCLRTWFFVQNVDVNYAGVVKARKENFIQQGLTNHTHYIASTGIEGRDADPSVHVLMDAYAVKGIRKEQIHYLRALSHLSPTYLYGVTFERGVRIDYGDRQHLIVSGTASIDHKGEVVSVGDVVAQTRRMWENVEALLQEGGSGFGDLAQLIIYLRDASDYPLIERMFEERFPSLPKVYTLAPVCRPTWLIEMECLAIREVNLPEFDKF